MIDETRDHESRQEVTYLSFHDHLTGLYNRRFFEEELRRLNVKRMHPIGIIAADLNGLKLINDAFVHESGNAVLVQVAKKLSHELREEDIIPRVGGDEFIILLPQTNELQLQVILRRIDKACTDVGLHDISLSVSFGSYIKTDPQQNTVEFRRIAEEPMYRDELSKQTSQRRELINGILSTLHAKNAREEAHSYRVSSLAERLALALRLDTSLVLKIKTAGLLHDIGKIAIDYSILDKAGALTNGEREEVQKHSETGYRILRASSEFSELADVVLAHHERMDGKGYPQGLEGTDIRLESRILTVCDAFDATVSSRPYRQPFSVQQALDELQRHAGSQFDPDLIQAFTREVAASADEIDSLGFS